VVPSLTVPPRHVDGDQRWCRRCGQLESDGPPAVPLGQALAECRDAGCLGLLVVGRQHFADGIAMPEFLTVP
jgi:hypothetical protein